MTTGRIITDLRGASQNLGCGAYRPGFYSVKDWSGADDPLKKAENAYSMSYIAYDDPVIYWKSSNPYYPTVWSGTGISCGFNPNYTWPSWGPNDDIKLWGKMGEKMRTHKFNLAVTAGEARHSISMIAHSARSIAESYRALRRGRVKAALKHLGVKPRSSIVRDVQLRLRSGSANAWLSLTYGWTPLCIDAANAAEALAAMNYRRSKDSLTFTRKLQGSVWGTSGGFSAIGECFRSKRVKVTLTKHESTLSELGFTRPESVAWELLPFSFVVDWFLPIGNWLEALTTLRNVEGTYVLSDFRKASARMGTSPNYIVTGSSSVKHVILSRTTGSLASVELPAPRFKDPLSVSHATSAIALLQEVFGKRG